MDNQTGGTAIKAVKIEIPVQDLVSVLWIDDDDDFRASIKDRLEEWGFKVDAVSNTDKARCLLESNTYDLIIADVSFDEPYISGDEFIVQNKEKMQKSKIIAITGKGKDIITRREELEQMGVTILQKGGHLNKIKSIAVETIEERKEYVAMRLKETIPDIFEGERKESFQTGAYELAKDLEETLTKWLESREDATVKSIAYGDEMYSCKELADHIKANTDIGKAHLKMLGNLFKRTLRIINV